MTAPEIDPTQPVSERLNRRAFVGIATAATLAASKPASAQTSGSAHPPPVAENDPAIVVDHVQLQQPDASVPGYAAWPVSAGAGTPSIVVVMHVWGVDAAIRDFVRRLAKSGFAAIAPDLYARFAAPSGDGATDYTIFRPFAQRLERSQYVGDIVAAAHWLQSKFAGTKVGITGFCMGGHLVLAAVTDTGTLFSVACPFYGPLDDLDPKAIRIPVCASYGGRDTSIPPDGVRAFAAAMTAPNDFHIYDDAGHAFMDDTRPRYVASAAQDAWNRTVGCFDKYLRGATK